MARRLLFPLYLLSGFCILAFETIWIRTLSNHMGGTSFSSAVIVGIFFAAAAAGNLWASRVVRGSLNPLKLYGYCEVGCAVLAACCFAARNWSEVLLRLDAALPRHFLCASIVIAAPSFLNGATFPFLAEVLALRQKRTASAGPTYAANLFGAALGVLIGGLLIPHELGYAKAFYSICALLAGVGATAIISSRSCRTAAVNCPTPPSNKEGKAQTRSAHDLQNMEVFGRIVLIASGVLSILIEILSINYVRQFTAHSMYSVAAVLFAFIVNFGLGAALAARFSRTGSTVLLAISLLAAGVGCAAYPFIIQCALEAQWPIFSPNSTLSALKLALGVTVSFAPMHIPAGMVYPLAWDLIKQRCECQGKALGHIAAWNKFGSAFGAFVGPFVLFPTIGLSGASVVAGIMYIAAGLAATCLLARLNARRVLLAIGASSLLAAMVAFAARRPPIDLEKSSKLVAVYEGADGVVAVTEDAGHSRHIVVNNSYVLNGTERALLSQKQESWIPLLLCKNPRNVAFIGMASGISATAALDFPIEKLDAIEIVPEVIAAARNHFHEWNARLFSDPRASVIANDGRHVIQSSTDRYDLVICDLLQPAQEGTSSIYSRDFLAAAREKLSVDGKFCLWLPLYQLDQELAGIVIRTFTDVFPHAIAIRGNFDPLQPTMALIGSSSQIDLSANFLSDRLNSDSVHVLSGECAFFRSLSNLRLLLLGDLSAIRGEFGSYDINCDEHPIFAFEGPRNIAKIDTLCGFTFLNWFGRRGLAPSYPSCRLDATPPEELLAGIRAGNHLYAACISAVNIPVTRDEQLTRARQSEEHFQTACRLVPNNDLKPSELGH